MLYKYFLPSFLSFFSLLNRCRYCGARDTSGWNVGPWGTRTLCIVHYVQWRQKKTLSLDEWKDKKPKRPIAPEFNTEWKYKHFKLLRERMVAKTSKSRTKTMLSRRQKQKKGNDKEKHRLTMQGCEIVLRKIAHHRLASPFLEPVDMEEYPDYKAVVRKPMDLSTIWKKVKGFKPEKPYSGNKKKFARDMRLVFRNCLVYNDEDSQICADAEVLAKLFENSYRVWVEDTSRTQFDDVLAKLPEIPGEWLGYGLDEEEGEDGSGGGGSPSKIIVDTPANRLSALKRQLQKDRAREHKVLSLRQQMDVDEDLHGSEIQLREIHNLDKLQLKIKNQSALVQRTEGKQKKLG